VALTFPRALPDLKLVGLTFHLEAQHEILPLRSGKKIAMDLGPSYWRAAFSSGELTQAQAGEVQAWYDTLLSTREFYGYDKRREYPYAYRGGWPDFGVSPEFDGTCTLTDVEANGVEITLVDLPAGFIFTVGDFIAFDYGANARALHRVAAGGTASGAGAVALEVRPEVRDGWQLGSPANARPVNLYRAAARMLIVPGSYEESTRGGPSAGEDYLSISFEAVQTIGS
jgi:hypothetical protein